MLAASCLSYLSVPPHCISVRLVGHLVQYIARSQNASTRLLHALYEVYLLAQDAQDAQDTQDRLHDRDYLQYH